MDEPMWNWPNSYQPAEAVCPTCHEKHFGHGAECERCARAPDRKGY